MNFEIGQRLVWDLAFKILATTSACGHAKSATMRLFCRFKHWQLFLIWIISGTLFIATIETPFWVLTLALYDFVLVGWIYSIGKVTNKLNGKYRIENYHEDLWFVLFFISIITLGYFSHLSTDT